MRVHRLPALLLALSILLTGMPAFAGAEDSAPVEDAVPILALIEADPGEAEPAPDESDVLTVEPVLVEGEPAVEPLPEDVQPLPEQTEPAPPITLQLNGAPLALDGAAPMLNQGRVFLPFRTVFEAFGAEVTDAQGVLTATRGGVAVTMTVDSTQATFTRGGVSLPLEMDVAPYLEAGADGEAVAYVPVRFAAQALGCLVDWDAGARAVILVDVERMITEVLSAHEYSYLGQYAAHQQQFAAGIWDVTANYSGSLSMLGQQPATFEGALAGTMADNSRLEMDMSMLMDMKALMEATAAMSGAPLSQDDLALIEVLRQQGLTIAMRGDLAQGTFYMNIGGLPAEDGGIPEGTWIMVDMAGMMQAMGIDFQSMMSGSWLDMTSLLTPLVGLSRQSGLPLEYAALRQMVETAAAALADSAFVAQGDTRTVDIAVPFKEVVFKLRIELTFAQDKVVATSMEISAEGAIEGVDLSLQLVSAIDADNKLLGGFSLHMDEMMSMEMAMTGAYSAGETEPETTPPADAVVVELWNMYMAPLVAQR